MKKELLTLLLSIVFAVGSPAQLKGCFCDENNWFRIDFVSADSLTVIKPFYFAGHLPAYGYGMYKVEQDSLYIDYGIRTDTTYYTLRPDTSLPNDSITLKFVDDDRPISISFTKNTGDIHSHLLTELPVYKIIRLNEDLILDYGSEKVIIPAGKVMNKDYNLIEIKVHNEPFIRERFDKYSLSIINDSEIRLNNTELNKNNCKKKSTPIF
jgi:hypothetical protein